MFRERLTVPLSWWALATMFLASVLIAFLVATPLPVALGVTVGFGVLTVAVFLGYGGAEVVVDERTLYVGRAQIDLAFIGDPIGLDGEQTRAVLGVQADARAYLMVRPYLSESVKVPIEDPDDPTPYWLVMTRRRNALLTALQQGRLPKSATAAG